MLKTYAVRALIASTSRKSTASVVTVNFCQVTPPSAVRNTVLPEPLAHATRSLTALTPRRRAITPLVWMVQCGADRRRMIVMEGRTFINDQFPFSIQYFSFAICRIYLALLRVTFFSQPGHDPRNHPNGRKHRPSLRCSRVPNDLS